MNLTSRKLLRLTLAANALGAAALTGCASPDYNEQLAQETRSSPSPLATLYQRDTDRKNNDAITVNENLRMMNEDWDRLWLYERPSLLTPEPLPR